MQSLNNILKLALVVSLLVLLVAASFVVGYRVGDRNEKASEQSVELLVEPTTAPPTPTIMPLEESFHTGVSPAPQEQEPEPTPEETSVVGDEQALRVLLEVWDLVESEFYGELPAPQDRVYGAVRGMLGTLDDDYTSFMEPTIAEIQRTDASGSFEGIGALVNMNEEGVLEIVRPFADHPADKAGLLPGDRVLEVDGVSIIGYGIYEAITLIRGPEGEKVILTVQRGLGTEPFEVSIVRARIEIPIVEGEMLEQDIGYISLFEFSSQATAQLESTLEDLIDQGITSLILDLRDNPGGYLDQAVRVSDLFLDEGLVLIERSSDGYEREFPSTNGGLAQDIPLVVLVNGGSASASEIVAGAIQDRERAVLIGETTFGKGSVQLPHTLSDGSELRVTIARWFTPNDRAIHGEGLAPDIEVLLTPEDAEAGLDPQLERAVEYLQTGQ